MGISKHLMLLLNTCHQRCAILYMQISKHLMLLLNLFVWHDGYRYNEISKHLMLLLNQLMQRILQVLQNFKTSYVVIKLNLFIKFDIVELISKHLMLLLNESGKNYPTLRKYFKTSYVVIKHDISCVLYYICRFQNILCCY